MRSLEYCDSGTIVSARGGSQQVLSSDNSGFVTVRPPVSDALAIRKTHRAPPREIHLLEITGLRYRFILTDSKWTLPREFTPPTQRGSELDHLGQHHPGGETETQREGICLRNQSKSVAERGRENGPPGCGHVSFLLQSPRDHGQVLWDRCWPHLHCHRWERYLCHLVGCLPH